MANLIVAVFPSRLSRYTSLGNGRGKTASVLIGWR
jgi:hypothetical protein